MSFDQSAETAVSRINRSEHSYIPLEQRVKQECIPLKKLEFVSSFVEQFREEKPLKHYKVLNIQHEVGDLTAQSEALLVLGAHPSDLYFLPPCYSQHEKFESFAEKNLKVPRENLFSSKSYRLGFHYDRFRLVQVLHSLKRMFEIDCDRRTRRIENLLVLDDGGCFTEALSTLVALEDGRIQLESLTENLPVQYRLDEDQMKTLLSTIRSIDIRLVEQTSRGLFKYFDNQRIAETLKELGMFVVDVATSEPKKRLEPPLIAEATIQMLSYLFHEAPDHLKIEKPTDSHRCLLLGYGAIGQAISQSLTGDGELGLFSKSSLFVYDRDEERNRAAQNDGFQIFDRWNENSLFDYVIGCAGRCSLSLSSLCLLRDRAYLISASSAAVEFPFERMVAEVHSNRPDRIFELDPEQSQTNPLEHPEFHRNVHFLNNQTRKRMTIVNGGMPVTFIGILNPALPEKFDLTVACMISAAIQAVGERRISDENDRILPLDSNFSERICRWFDQV